MRVAAADACRNRPGRGPDCYAQLYDHTAGLVHGIAKRVVASHLERCATCRREVRDFREVSAGLAVLVQEPPPSDLRAQVLQVVAEDAAVALGDG